MSRLPKPLMVVALGTAVGSLGAWFAATPTPAPQVAEPTPELACSFVRGERRAYEVSSQAGTTEAVDRFAGTLSLEVVEASAVGALARAAFSEVSLEQTLSDTPARERDVEGAPFFVRIDRQCRYTHLGFGDDWQASGRDVVTQVLHATEMVVSGEARDHWQAAQRDGGGDYVAEYRAAVTADGVEVVRQKPAYDADPEARRLGIELTVLRSRAEARFDAAAQSIERVAGAEQLMLSLPDGTEQVLTHRFSMGRRDEAFALVAAASVDDVDFDDTPRAIPVDRPVDPGLAALALGDARDRFGDFFARLGSDGVFPAARFLADWLRANPAQSQALMEELRSGAIDEAAQASFFLAFELAGTDASREVLVGAVVDGVLTDLNRARAASALADHGEPSRAVADVLLGLAHDDASGTVSTVSRLGLGSLVGRADGALGDELRDVLPGELAAAEARTDRVAAIDAIANCGDDRFADALGAQLGAGEPSVRAHAAEALGRLSPEVARTHLVEQLGAEEDPQVVASVLRGLRQVDEGGSALGAGELSLAGERLASPHASVRLGLIEWLGRSADRPEVRRLLAEQFHRETDLRLKQRLGSYVSAAELRAAG